MFPHLHIIHLEDLHERDEVLTELTTLLQTTGEFFYTKRPAMLDLNLRGLSIGNQGCLKAHVELYKQLLNKKDNFFFVGEDDAFVPFTEENDLLIQNPAPIHKLFQKIKNEQFDIALLGYTELPQLENGAINFFGTHAMFLSKKAMKAYIQEYEIVIAISSNPSVRSAALPADRAWHRTIQKHKLKVIYPPTPLIIQKPGLLSAITGKERLLPKMTVPK